MADVEKLRERIVELALDEKGPLRGVLSPGDLHARLVRFHEARGEKPPASRATFYTWFSGGRAAPQAFLECVPAFAHILGVPEYALWRAAGVMPPESGVALALASGAQIIRAAHWQVYRALAESGLSTAGEALVVDRILHARLDYTMRIWPVVRGRTRPLHLHSWIVLEPIDDPGSTRRLLTHSLERGDRTLRRRHVREEVIGEDLWRTLGLRWRDRLPTEFAPLGPEALFIEVPVEERIRVAPEDMVHPMLAVQRILVVGAPWSHAELMAALLAEALQWGSLDLRYLGFRPEREWETKVETSRRRLADGPSQSVWALAQRGDMMAELRPDIVKAAPAHLVVALNYGPDLTRFVARQWQASLPRIQQAVDLVDGLVGEIAGLTDVIRVDLADTDLVTGHDDHGPLVDRHHLTDTVRYAAAAVLNQLYDQRTGPGIPLWGDRFEDLRVGDERRARVPLGDTTVRWIPARP